MSTVGRTRALVLGIACGLGAACAGNVAPPEVLPRAAAPAPTASSGSRASQSAPGTSRVSGTLTTADRKPLLAATVIMTPHTGQEPVPAEDALLRPDGSFAFPHVAPGRYRVRARAQAGPDGPLLFAGVQIIVRPGTPVPGLNLLLEPGAAVSGRIHADSSSGRRWPDLTGLRVHAPLVEGASLAAPGAVDGDGSFIIRDLEPGRHTLEIQGLQPPWRLKSVLLQGHDISASGLELESAQAVRGVVVIITDAPAGAAPAAHRH